MSAVSETREVIEWGVERTWPDGQTEVDRSRSRSAAESFARLVNLDLHSRETAAVVSRMVTYSDWTRVMSS